MADSNIDGRVRWLIAILMASKMADSNIDGRVRWPIAILMAGLDG